MLCIVHHFSLAIFRTFSFSVLDSLIMMHLGIHFFEVLLFFFFSYLEFAELLESLNLCVLFLPNMGSCLPLFPQILFFRSTFSSTLGTSVTPIVDILVLSQGSVELCSFSSLFVV